MSKIRLVGAAFSVAVAAWSADASATTYLFDPFGDDPSTVAIGSDAWGQWVGWQDKNTGDCSWNWIGDTTGLNDNYFIGGQGGDDSITVLTSTVTICGFPIGVPSYNGHWLDIGGAAELGNDSLSSNSAQDTHLIGGMGNDFIISARPDALLEGDPGNDRIFALGSGSGGIETGDADDDCLFIYSARTPFSTSCGYGNDLWSGSGTQPADCETHDTRCCGVC